MTPFTTNWPAVHGSAGLPSFSLQHQKIHLEIHLEMHTPFGVPIKQRKQPPRRAGRRPIDG